MALTLRISTSAADLHRFTPAAAEYLIEPRRWWHPRRQVVVTVYGDHGTLTACLTRPEQVAALVAAVGDGSEPPRPVV